MKLMLVVYLSLQILFGAVDAHALRCEQLFSPESLNKSYFDFEAHLRDPNLFFKVLNGEVKVPADVLLLNLEHFQNYKTRKVEIAPLKSVDIPLSPDKVVVSTLSNSHSQPLPNWLFKSDGQSVSYFIHPTNTTTNIPYFTEPDRHVSGPVAVTSASRSMFVRTNDGGLYSIKMGTNYPMGNDRPQSLKKLNGIQTEVFYGMNHSKVAMDLEKRFSPGQTFSMVYEMASVTPETNIVGRYPMMVRDLSFLKNPDRYYLPAFSIPTIGAAIANKHGQKYGKFWETHFAKILGEAKAELFFKYGMIMQWPHGQNILIETDLNFRPTGKLIFRDLDDMKFYSPAAMHLLNQSQFFAVTHIDRIDFRWQRSLQILIPLVQQDTASPAMKALARQWERQHQGAIRAAFAKALNIKEFENEAMDLDRLFVIYANDIEAHFMLQAQRAGPR